MAQKCIALAEGVLANAFLDFQPDGGGPDHWECSMCGSSIIAPYDPPGSLVRKTLKDISHEEDCPYVLAKELLGDNGDS